MAVRLRLTRDSYQQMERGETEVPAHLRMRGMLHPHEWCIVRRCRSGLRRYQVAKRIGRSEQWVTRMENGEVSCDRLLQFWEEREVVS